jgi:hypothetical protein
LQNSGSHWRSWRLLFWLVNLLTVDGDRSSLRKVVEFLSSTYKTMDKVQNKPNSSVLKVLVKYIKMWLNLYIHSLLQNVSATYGPSSYKNDTTSE